MIKKRFINEFTVWDAMNEARASIDRVRELHQPFESPLMFKGQACKHCTKLKNRVIQMYPCPTLVLLDGELGV